MCKFSLTLSVYFRWWLIWDNIVAFVYQLALCSKSQSWQFWPYLFKYCLLVKCTGVRSRGFDYLCLEGLSLARRSCDPPISNFWEMCCLEVSKILELCFL